MENALLKERLKINVGLLTQTLNNTNATGPYYPIRDFERALFVVSAGAAADTKTTKLEIIEARDAAGTGAQALANASATFTSPTGGTKATVALATVLAGQTVTINGIVFTAHASTTTVANREFSIGGTDTQDAAALETCINDATYGVPGVTAAASTGTITLTSTVPGATTISLAASNAAFTLATVEHVVAVEVEGDAISPGFTHLAAKVTTTGNTPVGVLCVRGDARLLPVSQAVGASAAV